MSDAVSEANGWQQLRLGFVSDRSAFTDGQQVWVNSGVGRLLDVWGHACPQLVVAMTCAPSRLAFHDHRLDLPAGNFLRLPWMPSIVRGFHKARSCAQVVREVESRSDALIIQLPFAAPLGLLPSRRPRVYHLCADIWAMALHSPSYGGLKRLAAVAAGGTLDRIQRRLIRAPGTRVVANSRQLLERYGNPPGRAVVSSSLRECEILSLPRSRPATAPFRVLYVGYLRRAKGIDTLIQAFRLLLKDLSAAELHIVGPSEAVDDGTHGQIERDLADLQRSARVRRFGHLDFGPELFRQFADADVLALPSRSEGTPRVLIEARAFGCPVVATKVGGIPSSVEDGVDGLLVPVEDPAALRAALLRVATDADLREQLVSAGLERARGTTVEAFARWIAEEAGIAWQSQQGREPAPLPAHG